MIHAQLDSQKLARFKAETNLLARHTFVHELMLTGGDVAATEFKRSLFDTNLTKKQLNLREDLYMLQLVNSMGYLAVTSNIARDFLVDAVNPKFWKTNISWTSELGEREYSVLAGRALVALAKSGRREFDAVADRIKSDPSMGDVNTGWPPLWWMLISTNI